MLVGLREGGSVGEGVGVSVTRTGEMVGLFRPSTVSFDWVGRAGLLVAMGVAEAKQLDNMQTKHDSRRIFRRK